MRSILLLFLLTVLLSSSFQGFAIDSTNFYLEISKTKLKDFEYNEALEFADHSIVHQLKNNSSPVKGYLQKGNIYKQKGLLDSALFFMNMIEFDVERNNVDYASALLQKGKIYKIKGNYSEALNNLKRALVIYEHLNDNENIGTVKLNIGNVFKGVKKYDYALQNYNEALTIFTQLNLDQKKADCYNNIGNLYRITGDSDSSFFYLYKTLQIRKKTNNITAKSYLYHNISLLHQDSENIDSALFYINESLKLKFKVGNEYEIYLDYYSLGDIYAAQEDFLNSIYYYNEALESAKNQNNLSIMTQVSKHLAQSYYRINNFNKSAKYYHDYVNYSDSLHIFENISKLETELISYEFVRDSLNKKQLLLQKEISETEKNNLELNNKINKNSVKYLFVILVIIILLGGLLYMSFKKRLRESDNHKKILEKQNKELKRTLISKEEKEILLKEIHHRVKNNLQIINSLIRLQSHYMTADNFLDKLAETENRIRSMALVHEKLYKSEQLSRLNANTYISELTSNILDTFESNTPINIQYEIENIQYKIDSLIPLGLIINEIISNSIKYAFIGQSKGVITIKLKYDSNKKITYFQISDNGIGADLSYDQLCEDSLGMELIISLCEQLDGEVELITKTGFDYFFTFPELK